MTRCCVMLVALALFVAGCGDSATAVQSPRWADFAGEWRIDADESSASYHNCENVNATEGGIRIRLNADAGFAAVTGSHNGGWGGGSYNGTVVGNLVPPVSGTLRLDRPNGAGTLTLTSITPTRMEGSFFAVDEGFAEPSTGRTPCRFSAVLVRP
ncbi:MAG: hypothetical protein ACR2H9_05910 [Longimicrobiaceae bacterium]